MKQILFVYVLRLKFVFETIKLDKKGITIKDAKELAKDRTKWSKFSKELKFILERVERGND